MKPKRDPAGLTITELAVVLVTIAILLAVVVPSIAGVRSSAGIQQSMSNLTAMSLAHVLYAADWDGRQVTWTRDDLGVYDSIQDYNQAHGCTGGFDPNCHPPIIAGYGPAESGAWVIWGYWSTAANRLMLEPILFPGSPNGSDTYAGWGHFRIPNTRPFHDYLTGRYHDWVYFAPNDTAVLAPIEFCLDEPPEFVAYPLDCNPGWSSYCFSPAAMFHPDVMRSNAAGGWQAPWALDHGYESPGLFQATYPDLKSHMLEHSWVQDPPAECNPAFFGCVPYYFNHGVDSEPVTLFYDGSVRLLPNSEVLAADLQILDQTKGVDGLWHRGTPFGEDGYLIADGFDGTPLSHHVLTTDGILGRDTLNEGSPMPHAASWKPPSGFGKRRTLASRAPCSWGDLLPFTPEEDQP
jgi:type II secretory pathway pseudopilin PulG